MLFIKQYELLQKIPIHGGGCKVFTVLCSLGKLADSTLSVYIIKKGVVFNSDHLENSLITSQNVMDLSIGNIFFQAFLEFYIHHPAWIGLGYRMKQSNIVRKLVHSAGRQQWISTLISRQQLKMNVNSHFKIQHKNGICISPISEINHLTNVRTWVM